MVYLLKMVIFHGYVSHNQRVISGGRRVVGHGNPARSSTSPLMIEAVVMVRMNASLLNDPYISP